MGMQQAKTRLWELIGQTIQSIQQISYRGERERGREQGGREEGEKREGRGERREGESNFNLLIYFNGIKSQ